MASFTLSLLPTSTFLLKYILCNEPQEEVISARGPRGSQNRPHPALLPPLASAAASNRLLLLRAQLLSFPSNTMVDDFVSEAAASSGSLVASFITPKGRGCTQFL